MKTKKIMAFLILSVFLMASTQGVAFADQHGKHKGKEPGLEEKLFWKAKMLITNAEEIGLTDEQVQKIKDLKHAAKKGLIQSNADIEILMVDIKTELYNDTVNLEKVNPMIDQKYALKNAKAKMLVKALADLKTIVTPEQMEKIKTMNKMCPICRAKKGGDKGSKSGN